MKSRIITGLILTPAAVALTLWSPAWLFAVLVLAMMLAALVEWSRLKPQRIAPVDSIAPTNIAAPLSIAVALAVAALLLYQSPQKLQMMCLAGLLLWAYLTTTLAGNLGIARMPKPHDAPHAMSHERISTIGTLVQGGCIFLFAWAALVLMRIEHGASMTLAMLLVIWAADTCAYLVGKCFGKHPLAPSISPGKTIEGLIGGLIGAGLVAFITANMMLTLNAAQTRMWLLASLIAVLFSVVGDLYESRLKRHAGRKDSGTLLPGHGGILDRIDGLLAACPAFASVWAFGWRLSA